jgi:acyl carrier protein
MLPSHFVFLAELPLTANGKIDRKRLPEASLPVAADGADDDPRGELEQIIAEAWLEAFGLSRIGRSQNFFELGGHSLTALQIAFRVRQRFQIDFPMQAFVEYPSIGEQARQVEDRLIAQANPELLQQMVAEMEQGGAFRVVPPEITASKAAARARVGGKMGMSERLIGLSPQERSQLALLLSRAKRPDAAQTPMTLPAVHPDPHRRYEPFPLNDIQHAYLVGSAPGMELGNISCQSYAEVEVVDWHQAKFEAAVQQLVQRHDMLRCQVHGRRASASARAGARVSSAGVRFARPRSRGGRQGIAKRAPADGAFHAIGGSLAAV